MAQKSSATQALESEIARAVPTSVLRAEAKAATDKIQGQALLSHAQESYLPTALLNLSEADKMDTPDRSRRIRYASVILGWKRIGDPGALQRLNDTAERNINTPAAEVIEAGVEAGAEAAKKAGRAIVDATADLGDLAVKALLIYIAFNALGGGIGKGLSR